MKCCKEAMLYKSQCYGVYYQLEGNWIWCADRVEKYLQVTCLELCPHGRRCQCCQPGCWPCFLQPQAVSHLTPILQPQAVSPLTPSVWLLGNVSSCRDQEQLSGSSSCFGLGIPITEVGRWERFVRAEIAGACFVRVRFWNNSCLLSSLLYNCFLTLANREIQTEPQWCYQQTF